MDYNAVMQLVGSLGFPIVCCCALFYTLEKQNERHKEEMDKVIESLNNNTLAISKLASKLGANDEAIFKY